MSFIYVRSLRIEFEVGINSRASPKRATSASCLLVLDFRQIHGHACNLPVYNGNEVIITRRRHEDWFKWIGAVDENNVVLY